MKNISLVLSVAFFLIMGICIDCGSEKPHRQFFEKAGGFSYNPPAGWNLRELMEV